ncbi:MAG: hypothetical protein JSS72_09760 [Armatimonadetes bacterium]|nr:hypothetical protein [Armatimonadota bacterium]
MAISIRQDPIVRHTSTGPVYEAKLAFVDRFEQSFQRQRQSEWCWAASLSNIFRFYGHPITQERIVTTVFGWPARNQPAGTLALLSAQVNRDWVDDNGLRFTAHLDRAYDFENGRRDLQSNQYILDQLHAGKPLLYCNLTHCMVLYALDYDSFGHGIGARVFDPWPLSPATRFLSNSEIVVRNLGGQCTFIGAVSVTGDEGQSSAPSALGLRAALIRSVTAANRRFSSARGARLKHDADLEATEYSSKLVVPGVRDLSIYIPDNRQSKATLNGLIKGVRDLETSTNTLDYWTDQITHLFPDWTHSSTADETKSKEVWESPVTHVRITITERTFAGKVTVSFEIASPSTQDY